MSNSNTSSLGKRYQFERERFMVNSASNLQDIGIQQHFYFSTFPSSNLYKCKLQCKIIQAYQRAMALIVQNGKMEVLTGQQRSGAGPIHAGCSYSTCADESEWQGKDPAAGHLPGKENGGRQNTETSTDFLEEEFNG